MQFVTKWEPGEPIVGGWNRIAYLLRGAADLTIGTLVVLVHRRLARVATSERWPR